MKSVLIRLGIFMFVCMTICAWYLIPDRFFVDYSDAPIVQSREKLAEDIQKEDTSASIVQEEKITEKQTVVKDLVKQSVPFIVQAPHAQWDDAQYQDACEEASMLMAHAWVIGEGNISKNDAEEEMEKIFAYEKEMFNGSIDTSAEDTATISQGHFEHSAEVHRDVSMEDIYEFLTQDALVLAPTNGKRLNNPNFSNGGPDRHMVVIIGYDKKNREFITNDPGTRLGRGYKYKDSTLYNAIRDYMTGTKEDVDGARKNVIVIKK